MVGNAYTRGLPIALERGDVTIEMIDDAVRRVLTLKVKLGLFEHPFPPEPDAAEREARLVAARALAREAATKSAMLLKNEQGLLPLKPQQRVALIGPVAGADGLLGAWHAAGKEVKAVSIREALHAALPGGTLSIAKGVDLEGDDVTGIAEAVRIARDADVVVLSLGEPEGWTGEAASRGQLELDGPSAPACRGRARHGQADGGAALVGAPVDGALADRACPGRDGALVSRHRNRQRGRGAVARPCQPERKAAGFLAPVRRTNSDLLRAALGRAAVLDRPTCTPAAISTRR